ncbi:MAG TPA: aminotransferase class V-fold PLP-dependent enzyme [Streptosporangiaceae bacterium]|nr:aminotransferase class V-fold PLP-dependent enzyme [Streptosporangiaceae bacterium]
MDAPLSRDEFPVCKRWVYLDHAAIGPIPRSAVAAMHRQATDVAANGGFTYYAHMASIERARSTAARMMGVPVTNVAFVKNTTEGLGFVANGLNWSPGDRVVVPDLDFPSTVYPWLALEDLGVRVDFVRPRGPGHALPASAFAEAINAGPAPRLVVTSWVQFARGWRSDLAELGRLCKEAGSLLCADIIQGLGVIPASIEEWGVDFAMADGHKWLLGPAGSGLLYVRDPHLHMLRLLEPGWHSVRNLEDWGSLKFDADDTARRLEGGMLNAGGLLGLAASLSLLQTASVEAIWRHVDRLCEHASERLRECGANVLSDRSPEGRSGIVTFTLAGISADAAALALRSAGVACSARGGGLRISPHGYNTEEDIEHLVRAVAALTR